MIPVVGTVGPGLVFQALADPTRRAVYERLAQGEATVTDLTSGFNVTQPAISQHLAALRRARLVTFRRDGRFAYYQADPAGLRPLVDWVSHFQSFWQDRLPRLTALLDELDALDSSASPAGPTGSAETSPATPHQDQEEPAAP